MKQKFLRLGSCIFLFVFSASCFCQEKTGDSDLSEKAQRLKTYFSKSFEGADTLKYRRLFFQEFPNNFQTLQQLYGYDENKDSFNILYGEGREHILHLFGLLWNYIDTTIYAKKLIAITLGGWWQADGVTYFQVCLMDYTSDHISLMVRLLSEKNDQEIKSFWHFYFDSPHPVEKLPSELQKIKTMDARVFRLMGLALKEVQKKWENP